MTVTPPLKVIKQKWLNKCSNSICLLTVAWFEVLGVCARLDLQKEMCGLAPVSPFHTAVSGRTATVSVLAMQKHAKQNLQ